MTDKTFKVTFLPLGKTVEVPEGWSVLDAALNRDIDLEHACGGVCACSTCHVWIKEGFDKLPAAEDKEEDMLDNAACLSTRSRLKNSSSAARKRIAKATACGFQRWLE